MAEDASYKLDSVEVRVPDMMNLVEVLGLVLGLHQAEDIAKCHRNLVDIRYSPLTTEVKASMDRFDGLIKDYWAERGRAQAQVEMAEAEADDEVEDELPEIDRDIKPLGHISSDSKAPPMQFDEEDE